MNHIVKVTIALSTACTFSYGAITNYVNNGVTDPDFLSNTDYVGTTGQNAATISGISGVEVFESSFTGGSGPDGSSANNLTSVAGSGLKITDVDLAEIDGKQVPSDKIQGGSGASISITTTGIRKGTANGGNAVDFAAISSSQQLVIRDGIVAGGDGGNVFGLSANSLVANGGNAVYADTGTVNIDAGLLVGGNGGVVQGADAASLSALGGNGVDINVTTADIGSLGTGVTAVGGNGGVADEPTATVADTSGGNGLNLRWDLGQFRPDLITVYGGEYTGGNGGNSSAISSTANGGLGMLMAGGQSVIITNGTFTGGAGGVSSGENAQADGGAGASLWFANTAAGGFVQLTGGTFSGGSAGVANGEQGEEGYGLLLTASSSELSGINVLGRGLLVNAVGLPTQTIIKDGNYSQATFTSFVPPEFSVAIPQVNVFTIEGGTFGDIIVEGLAGSDGTIVGGTAEDLMLQASGENSIKLGSQFSYQDLYLAGDAVNFLSISNGVTSTGNVTVQDGVSTISLWNDSNFKNTTISSALINFSGRSFFLHDGYSFAVKDQSSQANFSDAVTVGSGALLGIGAGSVNVEGDFTAASGSKLYTTYSADGAGGINSGLINVGGTAEFNTGLYWQLANDGSVTNAEDLLNGIILATSGANSNITQNLDYKTDLDLVGNPDWWYGINGLTNEMVGSEYVLKATYGDRDLEEVLGNADPEFVKALVDLNKLLTDEQKALLRGLSEDQAAAVLEASYVRTPEMASALVGLQSVFADQIKDRTRSNLRFRNFGSRTTYSPMGAGGPDWYENMVEWTQNHLPGGSYDKDSTVDAPVPSGTSARSYKDMRGINGGTSKDSYNRLRASREGVSSKDGYNKLADNVNNATSGSPREKIDVPETYQVWGRGYMSTISQGSDSAFAGYDATVAGAIMGVDKRFHNMLLGVGAGYAKTMLDGNDSNDGDADTGHVVVYYAANGEAAYFDANINYAFNGVETTGNDALGYEGDYNAHTVGFYVGGGYGFSFMKDSLLFTPEVSMLSTLYTRDAYTETSSEGFADKAYGSYDTQSYLSSVGATLSMIKKFESFRSEIMIQPELRVHWLHEFNADPDADSYAMIPGNEIAVALQAREEDLLKLGAGVRMAKWDNNTTEVGMDLDAALGENYDAVTLSAKILHRF